jgi:hypothetical protein
LARDASVKKQFIGQTYTATLFFTFYNTLQSADIHLASATLSIETFSVSLLALLKAYGTKRKASVGLRPCHSLVFVTEAFNCRLFSVFPLLRATSNGITSCSHFIEEIPIQIASPKATH